MTTFLQNKGLKQLPYLFDICLFPLYCQIKRLFYVLVILRFNFHLGNFIVDEKLEIRIPLITFSLDDVSDDEKESFSVTFSSSDESYKVTTRFSFSIPRSFGFRSIFYEIIRSVEQATTAL